MPELEDDVKKGGQEDGSSGDDQTGKQEDSQKQQDASEETITLKKSEHAKILSDLDNYRKATLEKKADRKLEKKDEVSQDNQGSQTIDVKKVEEISTAAASKVISQKATKDANKRFLETHSEYLDDKEWQELMTHYHSKRGALSPEDILEDFEDAVLTHKRATGQLETYLNDQAEQRRKQNELNARAEAGRDTGSNGSKTNSGGSGQSALTPEGERMAAQFGHDPKAVAKVAGEDRTINIIKKK